jgi:hypothetical protein
LHAQSGPELFAERRADECPVFRQMQDGVETSANLLPMQQAAATGKPVYERLLTAVFPDGTRREELANAVPLLDEEGRRHDPRSRTVGKRFHAGCGVTIPTANSRSSSVRCGQLIVCELACLDRERWMLCRSLLRTTFRQSIETLPTLRILSVFAGYRPHRLTGTLKLASYRNVALRG